MRLAYICADPGVPVFGRKGCSIHVQEVLRSLLRHGVDIDLFATRFDADPPPDLRGIRLNILPALPRGDLKLRERAALDANHALSAALHRCGPFDLVYERYSLWSFAGMEFAQSNNISGLLEVNAPLIDEQAAYRSLHDRGAAIQVAQRVFEAASTLIAVSQQVADYLDTFALRPEQVAVVPNGVDVNRFVPHRKATMPSLPGITTIGFIGTLKPWHGVSELIAAVDELTRQRRQIRLLIVGDGPELESIRRDACTRQIHEFVTFTGSAASDDIPGLLASMDITVAPYPARPDFYFSPLKVFEYMAAGKAIVASRIGQMTDVLEDGQTALLSEPGDVADLVGQLSRLLDDEPLRKRIARAARKAAVAHHSWDAAVDRILALAIVNAHPCMECVP